MTAAELAALIQFLPEVKLLIQMLVSTPEEQHQAIMSKVANAFDEVKNNNRPGSL